MEAVQVAVVALGLAVGCRLARKRRKQRKYWTRPWIQKRTNSGVFQLLYKELETEDPVSYKNYLRMSNVNFMLLLSLIKHRIAKQNTVMRESIPAHIRLALTLRFLATGETYTSLMYSTRIPVTTVAKIVPNVCKAIFECLRDKYLKMPQTKEDWMEIAEEMKNRWNFPNCIGALDGKHIVFRAPKSAGSLFYNYKNTNSIVLLGLTDANYKFIYVDVGVNGRVSDGGVFRESDLAQALDTNTLNLPDDEPLQAGGDPVPFVIVADDAFPLQKHVIKPFPMRDLSHEKRIFNYRLSRARRVVENAFGILANRFRIFFTTIALSPEKVETITLAACALHNFLCTERDDKYIPKDSDMDRAVAFPTCTTERVGNRCTQDAISVRNKFMEYFNSVGSVPWQDQIVNN